MLAESRTTPMNPAEEEVAAEVTTEALIKVNSVAKDKEADVVVMAYHTA